MECAFERRCRGGGLVVGVLAALFVLSFVKSTLFAQGDPKVAPTAPAASAQDRDLQAAVELCFSITEDEKAAAKIAEVVKSFAAEPEKLLHAVMTAPPRPTGEKFELRVPFGGVPYAVTVVPPKRTTGGGETAPPAVVLDLFWNTVASHLRLETPALCWVDKYTPDEFSDAGRDSWRKILHTVSFTLGGDPDRHWLTGFSWSGHAGFDVAEHRPGFVRGFVSLGGGPRRNHFRLLPNLASETRIVSCVGAKDDAEMIWNLRELARIAKSLRLDLHFTLDPDAGHTLPLKGMDEVAALIDATPSQPPTLPPTGFLLADGDKVALPWLEIVEVVKTAVEVPDLIPVSSTLGPDEKRRATIKAMADSVARIDWKATTTKSGALSLALTAKGVKRAAILVKAPWFDPGRELQVTAKGKKLFDGKIAIDPATLLREARRTGDRQRPTLMRIEVSFAP
jgi:pimeloyl-ACP methyl ester carboxylesterase